MLYRIAHILRDQMPWLWNLIGRVNGWIFLCRYRKQLGQLDTIVARYGMIQLQHEYVAGLVRMFGEQPSNEFRFFRPHAFSEKALNCLVDDASFLAFVRFDGERIVGYCFMRSFWWGKCFRGYYTDYRYRRRGINVQMNLCATEVAGCLGLRTYGTISPENVASLRSAKLANDVHIVQTMPNGDFLVEYLPKTTDMSVSDRFK